MIEKCFFALALVSVVCACATGNISSLGEAVFEGCAKSTETVVSLVGAMCLWCGVLEVFRVSGATSTLAKALSPILRVIFPSASEDDDVMGDISCAIAANILGVSSAATPYALSAMEKLDARNGFSKYASDDMVSLSLLGCGSISLFPTTVITLRHAAGSCAPYDVLVPVWLCSAACMTFSLVLSRLSGRSRRGERVRK